MSLAFSKGDTVFVSRSNWEQIRSQFTDEEKDALSAAVCGEVICPAGLVVQCDKLGNDLATKLVLAMQQ